MANGGSRTENGGPPDANDPNGSQFWLDSNDMDPVWNSHDSEFAGHAIGYPEKADGTSYFEPGEYARRKLDNPQDFNARCANGYEAGVNPKFNGVSDPDNFKKGDHNCLDMDNYDMCTSSQNHELITDQIPKANVGEEGPQSFYNPKVRAAELEAQGEVL